LFEQLRSFTVRDYLANRYTPAAFPLDDEASLPWALELRVTLRLAGANDTPVIALGPEDSAMETLAETDAGLVAAGTLTIADPDHTDTLTAEILSVSTGGSATGGVPDTATLLGFLTVPGTHPQGETGTPAPLAWVFDSGTETFDGLAAGETLTLTYTLRIADGAALPATTTETLVITITGTNDAPALTVIPDGIDATEAEDARAQAMTGSGTAHFDDPDLSDTLTITADYNGDLTWRTAGGAIAGPVDPALVTALTQSTLTTGISQADAPGSIPWSYSANGIDLDFLAEGESLTLSYTLIATDPQGATATDQLSLTITGTNDGPVLHAPAAGTVADAPETPDPGSMSGVAGVLHAADADSNTVFTFAVDGGAAVPATLDGQSYDRQAHGSHGVLYLNSATGHYRFVPDAAALDRLRAGETLAIAFDVTVGDGMATCAVQRLGITLTGANEAVVLSDTADPAPVPEADEAGQQVLPVLGGSFALTDRDLGDALQITTIGTPIVTLNGVAMPAGSYPAALADPAALTLIGSVQQSAGGPADAVQWVYRPGAASLDFLSDGDLLKVTFVIEASDGLTQSVQDLTVTVAGSNDAPDIAAGVLPVQELVPLATEYRLDTGPAFSDRDSADILAYSATGLPDGLRIDPTSGVISGAPAEPGIFTIAVTATDTVGAHATGHAFTMVVPAPPAPEPSGPTTGAMRSLPSFGPTEITIETDDSAGDGQAGAGDGLLTSRTGNPDEAFVPPVVGAGDAAPKVINFILPTSEGNTGAEAERDMLQVLATLVDGAPLPVWLDFNPELLSFAGVVPEGVSGMLDIRVTIAYSDGSVETIVLSVDIETETVSLSPTEAALPDPDGSGPGDDHALVDTIDWQAIETALFSQAPDTRPEQMAGLRAQLRQIPD